MLPCVSAHCYHGNNFICLRHGDDSEFSQNNDIAGSNSPSMWPFRDETVYLMEWNQRDLRSVRFCAAF